MISQCVYVWWLSETRFYSIHGGLLDWQVRGVTGITVDWLNVIDPARSLYVCLPVPLQSTDVRKKTVRKSGILGAVLSNLLRAIWKAIAFVIPPRRKEVTDSLIFPKKRLPSDLTGEADDLCWIQSEMTDASQNTACDNHPNIQIFQVPATCVDVML